MAQPAVSISEDRTDLLGVPAFWHKPTADPPNSWDSWIGQFNLAITLRERCDPRELLKPPGVVHDDPVPKAEAVGVDEDASAIANRIARNDAAVRRVAEMNEERRAKGPRVAPGVFYYEVEHELNLVYSFRLARKGGKGFSKVIHMRILVQYHSKNFTNSVCSFSKRRKITLSNDCKCITPYIQI